MKKVYSFGSPNQGRTPPTQEELNNLYKGTSLENQVTITSGIQTWRVPLTGDYLVSAAGAAGGSGSGNQSRDYVRGGFGAKIEGIVHLEEGTLISLLIGQRGTINTSTASIDGTTGAGGGGTFVVIGERTGEHQLLMAVAGGNGGSDSVLPGSKTVYHGLASSGTAPSSGNYVGGGYSLEYNNTTCGKSFLNGGAAAEYTHTRGTASSSAGFGGGASNLDDGVGGGGGGYYGGAIAVSATSYVDTTIVTECSYFDGINPENGFVSFELLECTGFFPMKEGRFYHRTEEGYQVIAAELTPDDIMAYGIGHLSWTLYQEMVAQGYVVVKVSSLVGLTVMNMTVIAAPLPAAVYTQDYPIKDRILKIETSGSPEVTVLCSFDGGLTWKSYSQFAWSPSTMGMSLEQLQQIPPMGWLKAQPTKIRFKFLINTTTTGTPKIEYLNIIQPKEV